MLKVWKAFSIRDVFQTAKAWDIVENITLLKCLEKHGLQLILGWSQLNVKICGEDQALTDKEIIKSDESDEEENTTESTKISHTAGAKTAPIFLQYIMQQPDVCSTDIMLVKRLCDKACIGKHLH